MIRIKSLLCINVTFFLFLAWLKTGVADELKIASFETDEDLARIEKSTGIILERSIEHVTDGRYSLKVTFLAKASGKDPSIRTEYPQRIFFSMRCPTKDFSKYDFLEMDIYYDKAPFQPPFTTAATVEFMDSNGNFRPGWSPLSVYPGKQEVARVPIFLGMTNISDKARFSFSDVARIDISAPIVNAYPSVPQEDFSVYFDNIRLVSSAPQIPSKEEILSSVSLPQIKKINENRTPFRDGDIEFRVQAYAHFSDGGNISEDKLISLEEDIGLKRDNELVVEVQPLFLIRFFNEFYAPTEKDWQDFALTIQTLYQNKVPFVLLPFNFWAGRLKYQTTVDVMRRLIELSSDIGKEYFVGVRLSETEAISTPGAGYMRFEEKEKDLEKVDAFVNIVKTFIRDIGIPKDKLLFLDVSIPLPYDWLLTSGADVVGQAFLPVIPVELTQSTLRGMSKSFNKWWEWQITRWPISSQNLSLPFDPKTGRPTDTVREFDKHFFSRLWTGEKEFSGRDEEVFSGDVHKMYLSAYFNGARVINAFSEDPHRKPYRDAITKFMEFVRTHPRGKEVVSRIAVMKSKGCRWEIPRLNTPEVGSSAQNIQDLDFLYLNTFFPGFSDDGIIVKYWWTGTPYGSVDLIYPSMSLEEMKKYNVLIFLGYNRMDSVRQDSLNDLMEYVRDGGIAVLSIEQLRNTQEKIEGDKLENFLGIKIEDTSQLPPKERIKKYEYIEITEETYFKLKKKKIYAVRSEEKDIFKVVPQKAIVVARCKDKEENPILLLNHYGKGYVFLFATPSLSTIPPEGNSPFIRDILDKVCSYKPLPVDISPRRSDIAFTLSKSGDKEAVVFVMNHGEKEWSGEIIINLKEAGLFSEAVSNVTIKVGKGYETKDVVPQIDTESDNLIVSGITLSGDTDDFCSYRQASFAYISLGKE